MISEAAAWAIFFLPIASFLVIGLVVRPFFNRYARVSAYLAILAIGGSLALSCWALQSVLGHEEAIGWAAHEWVSLGGGEAFIFSVGIYMDSLTAIMLVVASSVSLMVQIYSMGYMKGDAGYARYFAIMSLFTAAMLGLVMARNLIQLFVFWELVGLSSYLLIGFWYQRAAAAAAAKKAFIVTRIGDFGLLLAILYFFFNQETFTAAGLNSLEIPDIHQAAVLGLLGTTALAWLAGGIFAGAIGKSAQIPLHTWLPDAMEGPTPVSALIHAATMVAAGVFLVARFFPVFAPDPHAGMTAAMTLVALIGGITAFFGATMGLVMHDIKRVLAYSTISQLGYMMLALGVGAYDAAIFHLFTHAFFKALLFLGSGSVNHAAGTFDMRYMGGLRKHMKWTYATFLLGGLSLAGFPFFAGWWSKDEILAHAFNQGGVGMLVYVLGILAALMTAFYIFRVIFLTFHGEFRGGVEQKIADASTDALFDGQRVTLSADEEEKRGGHVHLGESPATMVLPMVLLAVAAVAAGFIANPPFDLGAIQQHWFSHNLVMAQEPLLSFHEPAADINVGLALVASAVAIAGILLAYWFYVARRMSTDRVAGALPGLYRLVYRKYYVDELYEGALVSRVFYKGIAFITAGFDSRLVDGVVNVLGWTGRNLGRAMAQAQTGQVQVYGIGISAGIIVLVAAFLIWG